MLICLALLPVIIFNLVLMQISLHFTHIWVCLGHRLVQTPAWRIFVSVSDSKKYWKHKSTEIRSYRPLKIWAALCLVIIPYLCCNFSHLISSLNTLFIFYWVFLIYYFYSSCQSSKKRICNTVTSQIAKAKLFWSIFYLPTADHTMTHFKPQAVEIVCVRLPGVQAWEPHTSGLLCPTYGAVCEILRTA